MSSASFGYTSGSGSHFLGGGMAGSRFQNTNPTTVYVSDLVLLNVNTARSVTWQMAIYSDSGVYPNSLMAETDIGASVTLGANTLPISGDPVPVPPGGWVWLFLRCTAPIQLDSIGASSPPQLAINTSMVGGGSAFPDFFPTRAGLDPYVAPITAEGDTVGPGTPSDMVVPEVVAEPLSEGYPNVMANEVVAEPLSEGYPNVMANEVVAEPLSEGYPNVMVCLVVGEVLMPVEPDRSHMSDKVFPALPGLSWNVKKSPAFKTKVDEAANGVEFRSSLTDYPRWMFDLTYDYLPDDESTAVGVTNLKSIEGLFLLMRGRYDTFLFQDPDDYLVVDGEIATADAATLQFSLARDFGGFLEPIGQIDLSTVLSFLPAAVTTGTDTITSSGHGLTTGDGPYFLTSTGTLPTGLSTMTPYWVIVVDANNFKLASSSLLASLGTAVNITTQGTGVHSLTHGLGVYATIDEDATVPTTPGPYTVTVAQAATYLADGGVTASGVALVAVAGPPAAGQYSVDPATGTYTFNSAQHDAAVVITYTYQMLASGWSITMPNQLIFDVAPTTGIRITADFQFYFVCRFNEDKQDYEKFANKLWQLQKCEFRSVLQ